jgi:PIN domain-containing protein
LKRPSAGKARSPSPSQPKKFVLYLDENPCNSRAIHGVLNNVGIRFERHLAQFPPGTLDEVWLPLVGSEGWVLLTTDKRIRYNFLEKRALEENVVREFVFTSGNMSGQDMAAALELAIPKMIRLCGKLKPPFVAAITRTGEVHLRWPKD